MTRKALIQPDRQTAIVRNHKAFNDDTSLKRGGAGKTQKELDEDTTEFLWSNTPHVSDGRVALWVEDTDNSALTTAEEKTAMISEEEARTDGFYRPDPFKPILVALSPPNNTVDVDAAINLIATFDGPITFGTGSVHLYDGADQHVESLTAIGGPVGGSGTLNILGKELNIDFFATLKQGERYYVLMDEALINGFAGISDKLVWNWKIALAPVTRSAAKKAPTKKTPAKNKRR